MKTLVIFGLAAFALLATCGYAKPVEEDNSGVRVARSPFWGKYWHVEKSAPPPPPPVHYWAPKVIVVYSGPPKKVVRTTTTTPEPETEAPEPEPEEEPKEAQQVVVYKSYGPKKWWGR